MPMKWFAVNFEKEKSNREKEEVEHENERERAPEIILLEASPHGMGIHLMQ